MKRIAIAADTKSTDSQVAERPGHCRYFCIISEKGETKFIENPGQNAGNAFGRIAFNTLAEENVNIIVAGFFGPRFQRLALQEGIQLLVPPPNTQSIRAVIQSLKA